MKWPTLLTDILVVSSILAWPSQLAHAVEWINTKVRRVLFPTPQVNVRPLAASGAGFGVFPHVLHFPPQQVGPYRFQGFPAEPEVPSEHPEEEPD